MARQRWIGHDEREQRPEVAAQGDHVMQVYTWNKAVRWDSSTMVLRTIRDRLSSPSETPR